MLFRDVINLIVVKMLPNNNDVEVETEISRRNNIFANKKSVRQSEFYQAAAQDINLIQMFEMRTSDYNGENKVEFEGKAYYIVRTYDKNNEIIQLICSDKLTTISASGIATR